MCRKLLRGFLAAVLALSLCSTGALAVTPYYSGQLGHCNVYSKSVCVDSNGDGICDYHGSGCRRYGYQSVRRHHLCRRPGNSLCHYTANGSWVCCADADCDGYCDICGRACPVNAGNAGNTGNTGNAGNAGNSGNTSGNTGSSWNGGNTSGNGSYGGGSAGNGYYGNYGSGYYGGGYCGGSGHHSGHHGGGHC